MKIRATPLLFTIIKTGECLKSKLFAGQRMKPFSSVSLACVSNHLRLSQGAENDEPTSVVPPPAFAVKRLLVLMLVAALSVVSAHKASATQPYALQPSQLTTLDRTRTADGRTRYLVVFTFPTGGYTVNFPPTVTRLYDNAGNLTNDFVLNLSATGPSPGQYVTQQITKQEALYDLGVLTVGQYYTFTVNQQLSPTTLASQGWTR